MKMFTEKRFRYGTFSTAMMLLAFVLFVLVNLLADEFNRSFDLTNEQIFSLTSQSRDFLAELDQDVTIIHVARTGQGHPILTQLLEEYSSASRHITIDTRDPMLTPAAIQEFAIAAGIEGGIPDDSIIVESATGLRVLTPMDMLGFEYWMGQPVAIRSFNFESEITRAIHGVTQGIMPVVYYVTGSGESEIPTGLRSLIESEGFVIREINLVLHDVPETADILFVPQPTRDWTEVKADRILDFLDAEGRAFFALGFWPERMPNLDRVLGAYGIELGHYLIMEGNMRNIFMMNPHWIMPISTTHEIVEGIVDRGFFNLLLEPTSISPAEFNRPTTTVEVLLGTSRDAFARTNLAEPSPTQTPDDIPGQFALAVAITDTHFVERTLTTQMVVVGNAAMFDDAVSNLIGDGNRLLVVNALRWLSDQPPSILIPGRIPPGAAPLLINQFQSNIISGIAMGGIPLIFIGIGVFIWFRRRHS